MSPVIIIFIVTSFLLLLSDVYIIWGVINKSSWWWKTFFLLPTVFYYFIIGRIIVTTDLRQQVLNLLFWLTLLIFLPILFFAIFSIIGKCIGLMWGSAPMVFNLIALGLDVAWIAVALYGITVGWKKVTVENVEISLPKIPAMFNGYRIVQLSDFHIGTYSSSPSTVERIVEKINSLNPDAIVFTGDLVNNSADEVLPFIKVLARLQAPDGIYSVLGNHDYCLYRNYERGSTPATELGKVIGTEEEIGWHLLRNEHITITRGRDSIAIAGVDNAGSGSFPNHSNLAGAIKGISGNEFTILLSHDPSHWRREVLPSGKVDLMLAGHTHAMQFRLGNWSPSKYAYQEWGGLYTEADKRLFVSTGVGENIAFRFGVYPQIVLITLHN